MTLLNPPRTTHRETILQTARRRIEVGDDELALARQRRADLANVLKEAFPGSRGYVNGSIAHGDALTPLTDVDLGVVIPDPDNLYGPGKRGPREFKHRAAEAIRGLRTIYPKLIVELNEKTGGPRKRSILVRFGDPVTAGQTDFTADVIVAIDNPFGAGLYIPSFDQWDRSDPEKHTELVADANHITDARFARTVRLVKHWNRRNDKPLCSWNIKALALPCILTPGPLFEALETWFQYAISSLTLAPTADPAHVAAKPIKLNDSKTEVLRRLRLAAEALQLAKMYDEEGYPALAQETLAGMFNDTSMLPRPSAAEVLAEQARRLAAQKAASTTVGSPALVTGTGAGGLRPRDNVRSWGH